MLVIAIVLITAALVWYTVGVMAELRAGRLRPWHVVAFLLGLTFDATGTFVMGQIARTSGAATVSGPLASVMAVTGAIALVLMALHATWALVVLVRNRASELLGFHRFSLWVWAVWLIPYATGAASAMIR